MADAVSLRKRRQILLGRAELRGAAFCAAMSDEADAWLAAIGDAAPGTAGRGHTRLALLAVGGYGRRQLCPYSDLDLVLVHDGRRPVAEVADAIWYPVWDDGVALDHSVRQPRQVLAAAAQDLRVALGLLDGRLVWGDGAVATPLVEAARAQWRATTGAAWLPTLADQMAAREARHGEVAFLLEPDLKEARGGLRDVHALHAMADAAPELGGAVDLHRVDRAAELLLGVRVELHRVAGRALDRLVLQEQDPVAAALGYPDADALMAAVAAAGRTIAWACNDALRRHRRRGNATSHPPGRSRGRRRRTSAGGDGPQASGEPGIALSDGEVVLTPDAQPDTDPSLPFRLAAVAAEHGAPIAPVALQRLAKDVQPLPDPWPAPVRQALVRALVAGPPAVEALEALDQVGLLPRMVPEWALVRNRPQRNAYHRFTVDRHLLEAAAEGAALASSVDRPDLLVVGCLLHDIGKGVPERDHTEAGVDLVDAMARRMGFAPPDAAVLVAMCRHHLLLADTATRRDLEDPRTVETVTRAVGDRATLRLLAALTEADSRATGTAAWSPWKAALVAELVERADRQLAGLPAPAPPPHPAARHAELVSAVRADGRAAARVDPPHLVVAALDRRGLLASVTGVLAVHGLDVRQADVSSVEGVAVEEFVIETGRDRWPDPARILSDLDAVTAGRMDLGSRLAARAADYAAARRPRASRPSGDSVHVDLEASVASTVVDVQAADRVGLLHRLAGALSGCGLDVVSARASTVGDTALDAFYVRDATGHKVSDPAVVGVIERSIAAALAAESP